MRTTRLESSTALDGLGALRHGNGAGAHTVDRRDSFSSRGAGMSVLIGALVVALVVLVAMRTGGRIGTAVGTMRLTRERRVTPDRRRLQVRVPFERRRGPRREEEIAGAFLRRVHAGANVPRGRRSTAL